MKVVGVIPARLRSTRFPGKVLADLCGKPMIQHVYERARSASLLSDLMVACDAQEIFERVRGFGGRACMTSSLHLTGTERVAEAIRTLDCDGVVNIQADEPLLTGLMIDQVIRGLSQSGASMSTLARPMKTSAGLDSPHVVKVVCDEAGYALYFSRAPIPYGGFRGSPPKADPPGIVAEEVQWLKHIGLYGYRKDFLLKLAQAKPTPLESQERLEQLRALETGGRIRVMFCEEESMGVDTPQDLEEVKKILCRSISL